MTNQDTDAHQPTTEQKREAFIRMLREKAEKRSRNIEAGSTAGGSVTSEKTMNAEDIPSAYHHFESFPEIRQFQGQYVQMDQMPISNPFFKVNESIVNSTTKIRGREYISYSSYNYLGFSGHQAVNERAKAAIDQYGSSVSASRIASGEKPIHLELESELAEAIGTEESLVFVSGHATNVTVIGHMFGAPDLIVYDELSHNSILQGCSLSGAKHEAFPHNDAKALERILQQRRHQHRRVLIVIEGVYSMDGDIADLPAFIELKKKYNALLMVDEAHSFGVIGRTGYGIGEHFGIQRTDVDIWMGTLSKTLASCGGYIAGSATLIRYLKYTVPGFMYSVGITPPNAAAALQALRLLKQEPQRVKRLHYNSRLFLSLLKEKGYDTGLSKDSAIVPMIIRDSNRCLQLADLLFQKGINVQPILFPAVPEYESRLRFFITSEHSEEQIRVTTERIDESTRMLGLK